MKRITDSNPKLTTRLSIALALIMLIVMIVATIAAGITAYMEARDLQDETLLSVGYLVGTNQVSVQYDRKLFKDDDLDDGVRVWEIGKNKNTGFHIDPSISTGFHSIVKAHKKWRVLVVRNNETGPLYAVVQKQSVSKEMALNSAFNTGIPLLGLLLLLPVLIYFVVRFSFKPLRKLSKRIESSDSLFPENLNNQSIPHEVKSFVSAIDTLLNKNQEHIERQRRFIADAAHELRTPITALSLQIENLDKAKDEATRHERQSSLFNSAVRLQRLVSQLLGLARSQGAGHAQQHPVELNELVRDQISNLIELVDEKAIDISVTRNEPVSILNGNDQLQHLIQNAITNAIKFSPQNGNIEIQLYAENGTGYFVVTDDGPGVSEEELARITEPFFRSAEHQTGTGAGLGLAICQEIAENLGGELALGNISPTGFEFKYSQRYAFD